MNHLKKHGHFCLPQWPFPERCCAWNPSHTFWGPSPGDSPESLLWKNTAMSPPSSAKESHYAVPGLGNLPLQIFKSVLLGGILGRQWTRTIMKCLLLCVRLNSSTGSSSSTVPCLECFAQVDCQMHDWKIKSSSMVLKWHSSLLI